MEIMQGRHALIIRLYFPDPVAVPVLAVIVRCAVIIKQIVPVLPHPVISRLIYNSILFQSGVILIIEHCLLCMGPEYSIRFLKEPAHLEKKCLNLSNALAPVASPDISRCRTGQHKQHDCR